MSSKINTQKIQADSREKNARQENQENTDEENTQESTHQDAFYEDATLLCTCQSLSICRGRSLFFVLFREAEDFSSMCLQKFRMSIFETVQG